MLSNLIVSRAGDARCFTNFVALLSRNAVAKRCVFADLYTWFIYNTLLLLISWQNSWTHVTQGVGFASCMFDWGISGCTSRRGGRLRGLKAMPPRKLLKYYVFNSIFWGHLQLNLLVSYNRKISFLSLSFYWCLNILSLHVATWHVGGGRVRSEL